MEDSLLEDLETLCRKHHRLEHGLGPTDFMAKAREMERHFNNLRRPPVSDWKELRSLIADEDDLWDFGDVMFAWVMRVISHERETAENWWMDKTKTRRWFLLAHNVRKSIQERSTDYVR